jgi:hypothetical protein
MFKMGIVNMELRENKSPSNSSNEASERGGVFSGASIINGQVTEQTGWSRFDSGQKFFSVIKSRLALGSTLHPTPEAPKPFSLRVKRLQREIYE